MDIRKAAEQMRRRLQGNLTPEDVADLNIPPPAVDLSTVPRDEWKNLIGTPLRLPKAIAAYMDGQTEFTQEERDGLEDRVAAHLGVTEPYFVVFEQGPPASMWLGIDR